MINFGIIGCGSISSVHAAAIKHIPDAQFVACCDIDPVKGQRFAAANDCDYYARYQDLLADPQVAVVTIACPHYLHAPITIAALAAGKHVVCEKPMAIDIKSAQQVQALVKASDLVYAVCYQNRFNPSMVMLKELIQTHRFGNLRGVRAEMTWHRDAAYYAAADWKGKWATEGGGVLINQAIHTLDEICWMAGKPAKIKGKIMTTLLDHQVEVEDAAMATAVLANGAPVTIFASNDFTKDPDPVIDFDFERAQVVLSADALVINGVAQALPKLTTTVGKAAWGAGHERLLQAVIHRIQGIVDPLDDHLAVADAYDSLAMVLGIYQSDATGDWQTL